MIIGLILTCTAILRIKPITQTMARVAGDRYLREYNSKTYRFKACYKTALWLAVTHSCTGPWSLLRISWAAARLSSLQCNAMSRRWRRGNRAKEWRTGRRQRAEEVADDVTELRRKCVVSFSFEVGRKSVDVDVSGSKGVLEHRRYVCTRRTVEN